MYCPKRFGVNKSLNRSDSDARPRPTADRGPRGCAGREARVRLRRGQRPRALEGGAIMRERAREKQSKRESKRAQDRARERAEEQES